MKGSEDKWWKKEPRSRRKCYRCGHLYSSHIDVACMKIIALKPERKACACRGFISDEVELQMYNNRGKNALKKSDSESIHEQTKFPKFGLKKVIT